MPFTRHELSREATRALGKVAEAGEAERDAQRDLRVWVARARALGASWTDVGDALRITRSGAHKRFGRDGS